MHLRYGKARGNSRKARLIYQQNYPLRYIPLHPTFQEVKLRLRKRGCFKHAKLDTGRLRAVRTQNTEEDNLQTVQDNPHASTRRISSAIAVNHVSVWRTQQRLLHPYYLARFIIYG